MSIDSNNNDLSGCEQNMEDLGYIYMDMELSKYKVKYQVSHSFSVITFWLKFLMQ